MCNKLIVVCLALVVISVPALASYIGFNADGDPVGCANPLKVDLTYAPDPQAAIPGWQNWGFTRSFTGPITNNSLVNPLQQFAWEKPVAELNVYEKVLANPQAGGLSRNRSGGFAGVAGADAQYSAGGCGFGMTYEKLTLTGLAPDSEYTIYLWDYEALQVWSTASSNPNSKFVAWSTQNPKEWLDNNYVGSIPQGGYGPIVSVDQGISGPRTDSNMPAGLAALVLDRTEMEAPANDNNDHLGSSIGKSIVKTSTNDDGAIVLYGWIDATDWSGSFHVPLNGFMVVPEPVTIALLGLGGLALIRRKRA